MSIAEFEGPPSWFLDASGTRESTKCAWVEAPTSPTHGFSHDVT